MASAIRRQRQQDVGKWTLDAFGPGDYTPRVRALKLMEEAAEAAQAAGVSHHEAILRVAHVYTKPVGDLAKEIGGVGITLLALAEAAGVDADGAEEEDFMRILSKPLSYWQDRNAAKKADRQKAGLTQ